MIRISRDCGGRIHPELDGTRSALTAEVATALVELADLYAGEDPRDGLRCLRQVTQLAVTMFQTRHASGLHTGGRP